MMLRDAVTGGLDWDTAVNEAPSRGWLPLEASTQIKIQLRTFAEQVRRAKRETRNAYPPPSILPAIAPLPIRRFLPPHSVPQSCVTLARSHAHAHSHAGPPYSYIYIYFICPLALHIPACVQIAKGIAKGETLKSARTGGAARGGRITMSTDAGELLATEVSSDMDVSVGGVVRRVALLLVVMIALGVGMYVTGVQYLFNE